MMQIGNAFSVIFAGSQLPRLDGCRVVGILDQHLPLPPLAWSANIWRSTDKVGAEQLPQQSELLDRIEADESARDRKRNAQNAQK